MSSSDEFLVNQAMAFVCTLGTYVARLTKLSMQLEVIVTLNALYSQNLTSITCAYRYLCLGMDRV